MTEPEGQAGEAAPEDTKPGRKEAKPRPWQPRFRRSRVDTHLRCHHPGCPLEIRAIIVEQICDRDWKAGTSVGAAVGIALDSFARHECTTYDWLIGFHRMERAEARRMVHRKVQALLQSWRGEEKP
ncbi:DUF2293 domain-containing protein [Inquilinus limosus]|uniref:DUF2293 domain-containing protein n=1 Tax=Inquilinus limosus TaxID=171674 RepID=UPI003F5CF69E